MVMVVGAATGKDSELGRTARCLGNRLTHTHWYDVVDHNMRKRYSNHTLSIMRMVSGCSASDV